MNQEHAQFLQETLYRQIPITQAMEMMVANYDGETLAIKAPLSTNSNHKNTAFGGSLSATTTASGWGLLFLWCHEHDLNAEIVIQKGDIDYIVPVTSDFTATAILPAANKLSKVKKSLEKYNRARLKITSEVHEAGVLAVKFEGHYVVRLKE